MTTALVERDGECEAVRSALLALERGRSGVIVVRGAPGSGRSSLLRWSRAEATRTGIAVAAATARRSEADIDLGVLVQLHEAVLGALPSSALSPGSESLDRWCSALLAVARRRPLLIVVDDMEWVDDASSAVLRLVLHRLAQAPVVVMLSAVGDRPTLAEEDVALPLDGGRTLLLQPLSRAGTGAMCQLRLAAEPDDGFVNTACTATGGNPAVLVRALEGFAAAGGAPENGLAAAFAAIAIERRVEQITDILDGLPTGEGLDLLRALAVIGDQFECPVIALPSAAGAAGRIVVDRLRATGLVTGTEQIRLADHVRPRVLAMTSAPLRRDLYASMAELAHRGGCSDATVGRILCGAPPVHADWALGVLRRAASSAMQEGRDREAAVLVDRALQEAVDHPDKVTLRIELGLAQTRHSPLAADRTLAEVVADNDAGRHRVHAADILLSRGNHDMIDLTLGRCAALDVDTRQMQVLGRIGSMMTGEDVALSHLTGHDDATVDPVCASAEAYRLAVEGDGLRRARVLARRALADPVEDSPLAIPRIAAASVLVLTDDLAESAGHMRLMLAWARRRGARTVAALASLQLAVIARQLGRLTEAQRHLAESLQALPLPSWAPQLRTVPVALGAVLDLERGRLDEAISTVGTEFPDVAMTGSGWIRMLAARGAVWLAIGDVRRAQRDLLACGRRLASRGWANPALVKWQPLAAAAMAELGDRTGAELLLAEQLQASLRWGTTTCEGTARLAVAKLSGDLADARSAERTLRDVSAPLVHAEAQVVLAERLLDTGDTSSAEQLLASATRTARNGGATALLGRIAQLPKCRSTGSGIRMPDLGRLSPAQARATSLALRGMSNAQIAEALRINRRTVELHLTMAYRKLGVSGRGELRTLHGVSGG